MDRLALRDAVYKLVEIDYAPQDDRFAYEQAVNQFNFLLESAKSLYPERADIQGMHAYQWLNLVVVDKFEDAVLRLKQAVDLRPPNAAGEMLAALQLPTVALNDVALDIQELEESVAIGLTKSALLLAGSIAESLLLVRHPDKSNRGPGLAQLVKQARDERLFGRDTLRALETLVDYRDLIHPRAAVRNKTPRNSARVDAAITAIKLLCNELQDPTARFN